MTSFSGSKATGLLTPTPITLHFFYFLCFFCLFFLFATAQGTVHQVDIINFNFVPDSVDVNPGDTVKWTLVSGIHTTSSLPASAKVWDSGSMTLAGMTFETQFVLADGPGPFPYQCDFHPLSMQAVVTMTLPAGCCGVFTGGFAGNTNCDADGKRNLADITKLIDRVYISKADLCCEENGNINGDLEGKLNLADITKLIDHVYISKQETEACL